MEKTLINNKWEILLPEIRADRNKEENPESHWDRWEFERLKKMNEIIKPGDTIVDVGAELGDLSALFAGWTGKTGRMILIEPSERYWPWIREIWKANNLKKPLLNYVGLMTEKYREVELSGEWPKECDGERVVEAGFVLLSDDFYNTLPKTSLDYIAEKVGKINIITIDVEGSELYVLQGADKLLREQKPVVFISLHPDFMQKSYNYSVEEVFKYMKEREYVGTYLDFDHEFHFMFK